MPPQPETLRLAARALLTLLRANVPDAAMGTYTTDSGTPFAVFWRMDDRDWPTVSLIPEDGGWLCHDNQREDVLFTTPTTDPAPLEHAETLARFLGGYPDAPVQTAGRPQSVLVRRHDGPQDWQEDAALYG